MKHEHGRLQGKRVAILAADGFEYVELAVPKAALWAAGAETEVVSLHEGKIRGMNLTEPTRTVKVDRTVEQADPNDYDALLIPGGFIGPDFVRQSRRARAFVQAFDQAGKPIATLCHGPWVLASADLVDGRRLASWPGIRDDIVHAGGIWRNEPLVRDGNWVSSRGPQDLKQFVPAMIDLFAAGTAAREARSAEASLQNRESSPQAQQPISVALTAARLLPGPTARTVAAAAAVTALTAAVLRRPNPGDRTRSSGRTAPRNTWQSR